MGSGFKPLDDEFEDRDAVLGFSNSMLKLGGFMLSLVEVFRDKGLPELYNKLSSQGRGTIPDTHIGKYSSPYKWFGEGISCEILKPGKSWQKGKIRIKVTLEFCPDEPEVTETPASNQQAISLSESPLDDIRRMINQESQ